MAKDNVKKHDPKLKEDIASFKASFAFIIFCVLIFITASNFENNREMYDFRFKFESDYKLLLIPFGLFILSAALRIIAAVKKKDESYSYFSTHDFLGLSSLFVVYSLTFAYTVNTFIYSAVIIGFAIGYYVKKFFGPDFYCVTLLNLAVAFGLWIQFGNKLWEAPHGIFAASELAKILLLFGVAATVLLIVLFTLAKMLFGKTKASGIMDRVMAIYGIDRKSPDFAKLSHIPVFISLIFAVVLWVMLANYPHYLTVLTAEIILCVQYVALGIYYTVKLINQ